MKVNVWISANTSRTGVMSNVEFPYTALCPSDTKKREFKNIDDVNKEILKIADTLENKGQINVGEAIYEAIFHFADHMKLVKQIHQDRITEYLFCKKFSCPPFPSLDTTPPNIVDEFITIDNEYTLCIEKKKMENTKNA